MIFNEWIKDKSLFEEINNIKEFPFITSYGAKNLDMAYSLTYGSRPIPSNIETMTVTDVANILVVSFGDNWSNQYNLLKDEILLGVESQIVLDETTKDDIIRITNNEQENKVSAFNSDDLAVNDGDTNTTNDDTKKESNRNNVSKKLSMTAIKQQLELFNTSFLKDVVLQDVSKLLSLSIY